MGEEISKEMAIIKQIVSFSCIANGICDMKWLIVMADTYRIVTKDGV